MTNKQEQFLNEFEKNNRVNDQADKFLNGAKYKKGIHMLQIEHMNESQWLELVGMNDYETLWSDADRHLFDLSIKKENR